MNVLIYLKTAVLQIYALISTGYRYLLPSGSEQHEVLLFGGI